MKPKDVTEYSVSPSSIVDESVAAQEKLRALYEIMALPSDNIEEHLSQVLKLGIQALKLDMGIISRIDHEKYTVLFGYSPDGSIKSGQVFEFKQTYCEIAYLADDLVTIEHMGNSVHKNHACYSTFALESYIGVPLKINGKRLGTLSLYSPKIRQQPFTNVEKDFFLLLSKWIGSMMERKLAEQAMQTNEQRYRQLVESVSDVVYSTDAFGYFTYISPAVTALTGYTETEIIGMHFTQLVDPEWHTTVLDFYRKQAKHTQPESLLVVPIVRADSDIRWVEQKVAPVFDKQSKLSGFYSVVRDITERRATEQALHDSEANLRSLINNTPAMILQSNRECEIEFLRVPGVDEELVKPMIGQSFLNFMPEDEHELARLSIQKVFDLRETVAYEATGIRPDTGEKQWYLTHAAPVLENDRVVSALLINIDISERRLAEEQNQSFLKDMSALQELHLELSQVEDIETLYIRMLEMGQQRMSIDRMGLFLLDAEENALQGTYGIDKEGQIRDERYYQEKITDQHWTLEILNSQTHVKLWENTSIYDDGKIVGTGWRAASALWNGQKAIGYLVSDNFITQKPARPYESELISVLGSTFGHLIERKRAEKQIQNQNEALIEANQELAIARKQAESANKLKSQFLATMSHELRTPLNAVIGYAQLQLAGMVGEMSEEQLGFQERILINAQHLLQLINEVLDLSKIEAGRMDLVERPFDMREFLNEIVTQNRVLSESKGLKFTLDIDDRLPQAIIGDRGRIKQVLINLVSNAIKFTETGSVTMDAVLYNKENWRITVTDTGIGIPSHLQETIFDEFRQAENGFSQGGTGLGLAIVRKLVLTMGGFIHLASEVGHGSTFTVTLPFTTEESKPKE